MVKNITYLKSYIEYIPIQQQQTTMHWFALMGEDYNDYPDNKTDTSTIDLDLMELGTKH